MGPVLIANLMVAPPSIMVASAPLTLASTTLGTMLRSDMIVELELEALELAAVVLTVGGPMATKVAVTIADPLMVKVQVALVLQPAAPLQFANTLPALALAASVTVVPFM